MQNQTEETIYQLDDPNIGKRSKPIEYKVNEKGCHVVCSHETDKTGYGRVNRLGRDWRIHQYVYFLHTGYDTSKFVVRHKCDEKNCCNFSHLELGSVHDNLNDMRVRDRFAKGEDNGKSKLIDKEVRAIKYAVNTTTSELAEMFEVDPKTIWQIRNNITWTHI